MDKLETMEAAGRLAATEARQAIASELSALKRTERTLRKLDRTWKPKEVSEALATLSAIERDPEKLGQRIVDLARAALDWTAEEREGRAARFQERLSAACAGKGLTVALVQKEPLELRIPPLLATVDLSRDRVELQFGRVAVARSRSDPDALVAAHGKAVAALSDGFDGVRFFADLRRAYDRVARGADVTGGWVEIQAVLFEMAMLRQPAKFRCDPLPANLSGYGKARFLFDLYQLGKSGGLVRDGLRLTLGPASGGSTRDKHKVFFVEDGDGRGAYHLTLRLAPAAEASHG